MESKIKFKPNPEYRLMDQVREVLRYYHYAYSTEQSYSSWILQYIKFYGGKTHPKDMGKNEFTRVSFLAGVFWTCPPSASPSGEAGGSKIIRSGLTQWSTRRYHHASSIYQPVC
jgi:hypothetical protein